LCIVCRGWVYIEKTGGKRAGHTAWVRMKKMRRRREDEKSHSPPAATNMHFKDGFLETPSSLSCCCVWLMRLVKTNEMKITNDGRAANSVPPDAAHHLKG